MRKPRRAIAAYREMLRWYAGNAVLERLEAAAPGCGAALGELDAAFASRGREAAWENLGGQIAPRSRVEGLLSRVRAGEIRDWNAVHEGYAAMADLYAEDKAAHAWACVRFLRGEGTAGADAKDALRDALKALAALSAKVEAEVYATRAKDYSNRFRRATFESDAEFDAVMGRVEDNSFVKKTRADMPLLRGRIEAMLALL